MNFKTKTFRAPVVENGETTVTIDIPAQYKIITGFLIHSDNDQLPLRRGSLRLELGAVVQIEDGEPARLYQKPIGADPVPTGEISLDSTSRRGLLRYRDTASAATPFTPHSIAITLYLR